ncbi:hypothetical protein [Vampirovibrio sp.]|uniref:hypothetical protein n=1 Tax=Vampirovibrio sp. TaxID=2717857 RepID=UPI003592E9D7
MLSLIGNAHRSVDQPANLSREARTKREQTLALCGMATCIASLPVSSHQNNNPLPNYFQLKMLEEIRNGHLLPVSAPEIQLAQAEKSIFSKLNMLQNIYAQLTQQDFLRAQDTVREISEERHRVQPLKEGRQLAEQSLNNFWTSQSPAHQEAAVKTFETTQKALKKLQESFPARFNQLLVNAVRKNHLENISILVDNGAKVDLANRNNWSLTSVAAREGNTEAAKLLEALGGQNDFYPKAIIDFARDMSNAQDNGQARSNALKALLKKNPPTDPDR